MSIIARSSLLSSCGLGVFGVSIGEHAFVKPKSFVESLKGTGLVSALTLEVEWGSDLPKTFHEITFLDRLGL